MTVVMTGSNGFTAFYLSQFIKENSLDDVIIGIDLSDGNKNTFVDEYYALDQFSRFSESIRIIRDNVRVFHLAGALGRHSLPSLIESNVLWTSKFIDVASNIEHLQSFVNIGSSAEYGKQDVILLAEDLTPNPITYYGISKHLQTQLALAGGKALNMNVVCPRTFNLIGPRLSESLVVGKMVKEFDDVKRGLKSAIELGRMDSRRDFTDVRDAVRIYWSLSDEVPDGGVFNVGSGISYEIKEVYQVCSSVFGFSPEIKQTIVAPLAEDVDFQCADISKLKQYVTIGDVYSIEESLRDMADALHR